MSIKYNIIIKTSVLNRSKNISNKNHRHGFGMNENVLKVTEIRNNVACKNLHMSIYEYLLNISNREKLIFSQNYVY